MPQTGKMLDLVQYLTHFTDLDDDALIQEAHRLINSGEYVLNGVFAGCKLEQEKGH